MATIITCPSGLSGNIRGLKVREERFLADRKLAKAGAVVDELLRACWEETFATTSAPPRSTRFARYAFDVRVSRVLSEQERRRLRMLVNCLKPAHTHFVDLLEPLPPLVPEHWELGLSDLDDTSLLHG